MSNAKQNFENFYERILPYLNANPSGNNNSGGGSGHTVQDNGTDMETRSNLNFVGFDIDDDSENDATEIRPHLMTENDWNEVMSVLPSPAQHQQSPENNGSTVSITPSLSTGTKIADYEIDGVRGVLYAPEASSQQSGTGENTDMGNKILIKIDDPDYYSKTVTLTSDIDNAVFTGTFDNTGKAYFTSCPAVGHIEISSINDNEEEATGSIDITAYGFYQTNISKDCARVNVTVDRHNAVGSVISVYGSDDSLYTTFTIDAEGNGSFYVYEQDRYTVKGDIGSKHVYKEVSITSFGITEEIFLHQYNVYAYRVIETDDTPSTRVEPYMSRYGCDNYNFTPAHMDYTNDVFDMGDWTGEEFFFPKPCMLNSDRTVAYYLDPDDYSKKADEVTPSDIANQDFDGNVMVEFPVIWIYRSQTASKRICIISDVRLNDNFEAMPYYTKDNGTASAVYAAAYDGTVINGKMRSLSGVTSTRNLTRQQEQTYAEANGSEWGCKTLGFWSMFIDLCYLITMTTDSKTAFGQGNNNGYNSKASGSDSNGVLPNGYYDNKGLFYGKTATNLPVKIFGIENPYGSIWKHLRGLINANGTIKVKSCKGTKDGSNVVNYNFDGTGYVSVPGISPTGTSGGYVKKIRYNKHGYIPYDASGSATTYETAGLWFNNNQLDYGIVGSSCSDGLRVGFAVYLNGAPSDACWNVGGSLQTESSVLYNENEI